ncbi:MAG TPA: BON domain-containing protein [Vicinamibacterales bacterium]|nr:BON domain-containing protein [Vicinamibacterales bacterium]
MRVFQPSRDGSHDRSPAFQDRNTRRAVLRPWQQVAVIASGAALFAVSTDGPDFGHYIDWAVAALDHDIFALRGDILSPAGVPYSLWSFEPGVLFALMERATGSLLTLTAAAYLAGWIAAIAFWGAAAVTVWAAVHAAMPATDGEASESDSTAIVMLAAMFVGTHAGVYSHAYATEVFGMSLVASVWALGYCRRFWSALDAVVAGVLIGLLFLLRPYLIVYAVGPVLVGTKLQPTRVVAVGLPLVLAVAEYLVVNRWMTGSLWHPPYLFGDAAFRSVDLLHPELRAVLIDPWHGLLTYHPLYGVAFAALVTCVWSDARDRLLWVATIGAVLIHLWVQSAWYIWWLGSATFGMRGMAPAAMPLVVALAVVVRRRPRLWMPLVIGACGWSFTLMLAGATQYGNWRDLLIAQRWGLALTVAAVSIGLLIRTRRYAAGLLLALVAAYLVSRLAQAHAVERTLLMGIAGAAILGLLQWVAHHFSMRRVWSGIGIAVFAGQAVLFAQLAIVTERDLKAGAPAPRPFRYRAAAPLNELRDSYSEYQLMRGFDARKHQLRRYLELQMIQTPIMSAADRDIVRQIRSAFFDEPLLMDVLMDITAERGVVHLGSNDTTREQRARAIVVARRVPGVVRVDDFMR